MPKELPEVNKDETLDAIKADLRQACYDFYGGILPPYQVEETIKYWEPLLDRTHEAGKALGKKEALDAVKQILDTECGSPYNDADNYGYSPFPNLYKELEQLINNLREK